MFIFIATFKYTKMFMVKENAICPNINFKDYFDKTKALFHFICCAWKQIDKWEKTLKVNVLEIIVSRWLLFSL